MKWIVLFSLISTNAFGAISIWIPHEKEIWSLLRKAERTPEMLIKFNHPGIEKLNLDRRYELARLCGSRTKNIGGISKLNDLTRQNKNCVYY